MGDIAEAAARIRSFVDARLPLGSAPGAVVGLTDAERTLGVVTVGVADAASRTPVEDGTRFQIGSISKSFAAIVTLQEVEAGRLDLHAPVTEYVPWFEVGSSFGPITLHHLLTHSSGLITGIEHAESAEAAVWNLRNTVCGFPPGERFLYSNDGYKLVGLVLETVTGMPIRKLISERILEPLGMRDSQAWIDAASYATTAAPHRYLHDDRPGSRSYPIVRAPMITSTTADGSIVSTATDMCAYARVLLASGAGLLSDEGFRSLTHPHLEQTDEPGVRYGYGLDVKEVEGHAILEHAGGMVGYTALLTCDVDCGLGAVMLINGGGPREETVRFALATLRALRSGEELPPVREPADPPAVDAAEMYAGIYRSETRAVEVQAEGGSLVLAWGEEHISLEPLEAGRFAVPHPDLGRFASRFEREGERVVALAHGPDLYVRQGEELPRPPAPDPTWRPLPGHYRSHNPWARGFRVYVRAGRLFLDWPEVEGASGERPLTQLPGGSFRVGEQWDPDRVRFEAVAAGTAQMAVYNGVAFYRSFAP